MFDANAVVSAALKVESVPEQALRLARDWAQIYLSSPVLAEIEEVLNRRKFLKSISLERRFYILGLLTGRGRFVTPSERVSVCRDPGDNMYLELALAANTDFLVSGDNDLLALDPWRGIRIVRPAEFVQLLPSPTA